MEPGAPLSGLPKSVLFLCTKNMVRSPMAQYLADRHCRRRVFVASAGIDPGPLLDGFVHAVLDEVGIDATRHEPRQLTEEEAAQFDLIITLSPEAQHRVTHMDLIPSCHFEYWPSLDPTVYQGSRDERLGAYRMLRDRLQERIEQRFDFTAAGHL